MTRNKSKKDIVANFERIAKSIKHKGAIDPHDAYEEELEWRWKKIKRMIDEK